MPQRILALDVALKGTLTRWWANHKNGIDSWIVAMQLLQQCFEKSHDNLTDLYQGAKDPTEHLSRCEKTWNVPDIKQAVWPHRFVHTLAMIPKSQYIQQLRRETNSWKTITEDFIATFGPLEGETTMITTLQRVQEITFQNPSPQGVTKVSICTYHKERHKQK